MKIVIIGGVAAGAKAAAKIKRLLPDSDVSIYTDDTHVSYSACGLPYYIEGNFADYTSLLVRSVEEFNASGIEVYLESKVEKILPVQQQVLVCNKINAFLVNYDKLIIATGARPIIPNIAGVKDYNNVYTLRKIEDGIVIRERMRNSKRAVIVGSGFIGIELLEAFVKNGLFVDIIEKNDRLMPSFDSDMSELIEQRLNNYNDGTFQIHTSEIVTDILGENGLATGVKTLSGKYIPTDMVILSVGIKPNSEIARDAGIVIGETGAIRVNKQMETSIKNIYACGDCCEEKHLISGKYVWVPLGSTANKEGECAALNAAGIDTEFEGVLGSSVTRCQIQQCQ